MGHQARNEHMIATYLRRIFPLPEILEFDDHEHDT